MFCRHCGQEVSDSAETCGSCGKPLGSAPGGAQPGYPPARTSGLAIASLVLGIVGLLTFGLTSLPGLVLGIIGLGQVSSSRGRVTGKGLAIGGIVSSIVAMMFPVLAIVAAIAIPNLVSSRIVANECAAIAGLRTYTIAQATFRRHDHYGKGELVYANPGDGQGFPDLYEVNGERIMLIDLSLARATSPATAKAGYYFVDLTGTEGAGPFDYHVEYGLCAVPAGYLRTGRRTLVTDTTGSIWGKDTGGVPPVAFPDTDDGWERIGF